MDILNKAGSVQDSAAAYPPAPKSGGAAPVAQPEKVQKNSANLDASNAQKALAPKDTGVSINRVEVNGAVSSLNDAVQNIQRGIEFSVDDESGRSVVRVVDRETGDVIRQLPAEDVLKISRHIQEFIETRQTSSDAGSQSDDALGFIMQVQA